MIYYTREKPTMYKNIIWDFDGTLFDSYPAIAGAFLSALLDHGTTGDLLAGC
jgi:phosphoglycolate phosphatase-like HAD superfamily hydrolase